MMRRGSEKWSDPVSIIIPAYNEAERIIPSISRLLHFCRSYLTHFEILCVDDGSTDQTGDLIDDMERRAVIRTIHLGENRGKGRAVRVGLRHATGQFRFFTDADLPYSLSAFNQAIEAFSLKNCDMVTGFRNRLAPGQRCNVGWSREIAGRLFGRISNALMGIDIKDPQCGFKGFTAHAVETIFPHLKTEGYAFDVEVFLTARQKKLTICEIPVKLVRYKGSNIQLTRDPIFMLIDLFRILKQTRKTHIGKGPEKDHAD